MNASLNTDKLESIWTEMITQTFKTFIEDNIGWDADGYPDCFKTGDHQAYCTLCPYRKDCVEPD